MADIIGSAEADNLFGTSGEDSISGAGSNDRIHGGAGDDSLNGGDGEDSLYGESGDDVIDGGEGNDYVRDGAGDDLVHGGEGDDSVLSYFGSDQFHGGGGHDDFEILRTYSGNTVSVSGGAGHDYLSLVSVAAGNAITADMGDGHDGVSFTSLRSSATLTLGAGRDTVYGFSDFKTLATSGSRIRITDWEGGPEGDILDVADMARAAGWNGSSNPFSAGYVKLVQSGSDVVLSYAAPGAGVFVDVVVFENIALAAFSSENFGGWSHDGTVAAAGHIVGTDSDFELLTGGSGNDLIEGGGGRDSVNGGAGDDEIRGDGGDDRLVGGAGDDDLHGGDGNDSFSGGMGDDVVHGGEGDDRVSQDATGNDSFYGEGGDDYISIQRSWPSAAATFYLSGGDGNDNLAFGAGNASQATIDAGAGDDTITLNGESGSHVVTLGDGADFVAYVGVLGGATRITRITDFQTGDSGDRLQIGTAFSIPGSDPFGSGVLRLVQDGADVLLQYDKDGASAGYGWVTLITLADTAASSFTAYNFSGYSVGGVAPAGLVLAGTPGDDRIHGNYGADLIGGGDGDDHIEGLGGDDRLDGGDGADRLLGESGADHLLGYLGNDDLIGGDGNDHLVGYDGEDSLQGGSGDDLLEGGEGADSIALHDGDDVAYGGGGNDSIEVFYSGNDTVDGGDGDDYIEVSRYGLASEEIFITGGAGADRIFVFVSAGAKTGVDVDAGDDDDLVILDGGIANRITLGAGRDVLELSGGFAADGSAVVTDFQAGESGDRLDFDAWLFGFAQTLDPGANPFLTGTMRLVQEGTDVLVQIDRDGAAPAFGWSTAITLQNVDMAALRPANLDNYQLLFQHGTEEGEALDGGRFDDRLYGEGGDDTIRGFAGTDTLHGGEGDDSVEGGDGADTIQGDGGGDVLAGGAGADTISGGEGADEIDGGTERDILGGDAGNDIVVGGDGDDDIFGGSGDDALAGGDGDDVLVGELGDDHMDGGDGVDMLYSDVFDSMPQHDVAIGGAGLDLLQADFLNITGSGLTMTIAADSAGGHSGIISAGADYSVTFSTIEVLGIGGTNQADQITTGDGDDLLVGRLGDDILSGGGGGDWLVGGGGADMLIGGAGNDRYEVDSAADVPVENEGEGTDLVEVRLASYTLLANFENLTGLLATGQTLTGNDGANIIKGGAGNDVLDGGLGADSLSGGAGNDVYYIDNAGDTYTEHSGVDEVRTSLAVYAMGEFIELLTGTLATGQVLTGTTTANTIQGADGDDQINGGSGNDTLSGGGGGDRLDGGSGADTMRGQLGDDVYVVDTALDSVIENSGEGTDRVTTALASYTLGANVENLTGTSLTGQTLRGNLLSNEMNGGGAGDTFRLEEGGADKVFGNGGNDIMVFGRTFGSGDSVNGGAGTDTLVLQGVYSGLTLGPATTGIEVLVLLGRFDMRYGGDALTANSYDLTATDALVAAGTQFIVDGSTLIAGESLNFNGWAELDGSFSLIGGAGADVLTGAGLADTLNGGGGSDVLHGGYGDDVYFADNLDMLVEVVGGGIDEVRTSASDFVLPGNFEKITGLSSGGQTLTGNSGSNIIAGGSGADTLYGGGGTDTLTGNGGNDTLRVSAPGQVAAAGGTGVDTLIVDYSAATASVRTTATYFTAEGFGGAIGDSADRNVSYSGIDRIVLTGGSAGDYILTAEGNDVVSGGSGNDYVDSSSGNDTLNGDSGDDELVGGTGSDILTGGSGNDRLNGGAGADSMAGGIGDDLYAVDDAGDVVTELAGEGTDQIGTSLATYVLGATFENLSGSLASGQSLTGNSGSNVITGWIGNDIINGAAGADRMDGQLGDDLYFVDDIGDVVVESVQSGTDSVRTALAAYTLTANVENLTGTSSSGQSLTGNGSANRITGGDGSDTLNGGAGLDVLIGGLGDDVYIADEEGDSIVESANGGTDEIRTERLSYSLAGFSAVENLTGLASFGQTLTGNAGSNRITGGLSADVLDGHWGADTLVGGGGDDVYYVDNEGDRVVESDEAGVDEIRTALQSYSLASAPNVEVLTGTSQSWGGQVLTGNDLNNRITGSVSMDVIDGGAGLDLLAGGLSSDVYIVSGGDLVTEAADGGDHDEVRTADQSYTLTDHVERLTGLSSSGQHLSGNGAHNEISGGSGDDIIHGGGGNDILDGGAGADELHGGDGANTYVVDDVNDRVIEGSDPSTDTIITTLAAYTLAANVEDLRGASATGQTLTGNLESNRISGGVGDDVLNGGGGRVDDLDGGHGDDLLVVDLNSVVWASGGLGIDTLRLDYSSDTTAVKSSLNVDSDGYRGILQDSGGLYVSFYGIDKFDLTTGSGDDEIVAGNGSDRLVLNGGADRANAGGGADFVDGGTGSDFLAGEEGDDSLYGGAANDELQGGSGNDLLDGGLGDDRMTGGTGDDVYVVDSAGDSVAESAGEGIDEVRTTLAAYTLAAGLEKVTALGSLNQALTGNASDNVLDGGAGADSMAGRAGNDIYIVDDSGDTVLENAGEGTDEIRTSLAYFSLGANIENLTGTSGSVQFLVGNALNNVIRGGDSYDYIVGGLGADTMIGGDGGDDYSVDNVGDVVVELAGQGIDLIRTSLAVYSLFGTEVETLLADSNVNHDFRGSSANNHIAGASGNDFLRLQDGGSDTALGGLGNDVFLFGAALTSADQVDGGAGTDQIAIQGDYWGAKALTLGSNVTGIENLALLAGSDTRFGDPGTGTYDYDIAVLNSAVAAGIQLVVDASRLRAGEDFTFNGSAEADGSFFVYGGNGVDLLTGGGKNDVFLFGAEGQWGSGDILTGGAGIDQLALRGDYSVAFGAGQLTGIEQIGLLSAFDTRFGVLGNVYDYNLTMADSNVAGIQMTIDAAALRSSETLAFNGSAESDGSFRVFGGRGNDVVVGSQNGDIVQGGEGSDTMTGGGGADFFRYSSAADSTAASRDHILDFAAGTDKIDLSRIDANGSAAGDQAFAWIGSNAFSGMAGQLRAYQSGSNWFVEGDTNGDGVADLVIQLTVSGAALSQSDFLP